jgi:hypothetical protein
VQPGVAHARKASNRTADLGMTFSPCEIDPRRSAYACRWGRSRNSSEERRQLSDIRAALLVEAFDGPGLFDR